MPLYRVLPLLLLLPLIGCSVIQPYDGDATEPETARSDAEPAMPAATEEPAAGSTEQAIAPETQESAAPVEPALAEPSEAAAPVEPAPPEAAAPIEPAEPPVADAPPEAAPVEAPRADLILPERGMSMKEVEARFGAPASRLKPVGKPPITRWIYPDYTVYFEYKEVLEAVPNNVP